MEFVKKCGNLFRCCFPFPGTFPMTCRGTHRKTLMTMSKLEESSDKCTRKYLQRRENFREEGRENDENLVIHKEEAETLKLVRGPEMQGTSHLSLCSLHWLAHTSCSNCHTIHFPETLIPSLSHTKYLQLASHL